MQSMSLKGLMELIGHEAIVPETYLDSGGVLTWGIGHTADAGPPMPSALVGKTSALLDVLAVFRADLVKYERQVSAAFNVPLTQTEFDAAVSFHFNTGAIGYATWVKKFNAGDRKGAVAAIMSWVTPASIKARRQKEQLLFDKGVYSNGEKGAVYQTDGHNHIVWTSEKSVALRPILAPVKLPPAPSIVVPAAKPVQPAAKAAPVLAVTPKAFPSAPTGFWARLAHLFHL